MAKWVRVAAKSELAEGSCRGVKVGTMEIAIFHLPNEGFYATDNVCSHEYALLTDGWMENGCIECPLHAAQFDIKTGTAMSAPANVNIKVYPVKTEGEDLLVEVPG